MCLYMCVPVLGAASIPSCICVVYAFSCVLICVVHSLYGLALWLSYAVVPMVYMVVVRGAYVLQVRHSFSIGLYLCLC